MSKLTFDEMRELRDGGVKMSPVDAIYIAYLRSEMSEGLAAKRLNLDRLTFRQKLGDWLKALMDNASVPIDGWRFDASGGGK